MLIFYLVYIIFIPQLLAVLPLPLSEGLHGIFPRNADIKRLGENCTRSSECVSGAICYTTCRCKTTHIAVDGQCWRKVEPGNPGCTYDEQCEAVWPFTKCSSGKCECSENEEIVETREGSVCVVPGACPTNGVNGALYERATNRVSTCLTFLTKKESSNFIGCDEYPEVYDCIAGTCCPTRGLTCIQPMSEGETHPDPSKFPQETRWFFNSHLGRCLAFTYKGNGGNSNNFQTQMQCESYCENRCQRGDPRAFFDDETVVEKTPNFQCKIHENDRMLCCPTPAFICNGFGGIGKGNSMGGTFSKGSPKRGADVLQRFYWDTSTLSCKKFKYYGQGGNFNNFATSEECTSFCSIGLCPNNGSPLLDPSLTIQRCSALTLCPETHTCHHSVCCPKSTTICGMNLKTLEGCEPREITTKWTYSLDHNMCKSIMASGCLVGDNQFESLELCQTICSSVQAEPKCPIGRAFKTADQIVQKCSTLKPCPNNYECLYTGSQHVCCPSKDFTCKQPLSQGTACGMSPLQRWTYDPNSNKCVQFEYLGCNGNDNNFITRMGCMEHCHRSECPDGGNPLIDSTNGRTIICNRNDECPSTHQCTRMMYTNQTSCCPSRKWICSHDADEGISCGVPSKRFFFDANTETCRQFNYLGCGGNSNSFSTRAACYQYCQSASCSSSEVVYQPSNLDSPFDCSLKNCPRHFTCAKNVWDETKNVCCGSPNFGVCSSTQHPMIDYATQQPMTCTPNVQNSCPLGFQCTYSSIRTLYFCCRDIQHIEKCLKGSRPEVWQSTAESRACTKDAQCASTTQCYSPIPFVSGLCCASVDEVCPATYIYEERKSESAECSPLIRNSCGGDGQSVCLYAESKGRFVCCRRETRQIQALAKCPPGSVIEHSRLYCDPENPCPRTHFCMKKATDRKGICCRHPSLKRGMPIRTGRRKHLTLRSRCPKPEKAYKHSSGLLKVCDSHEDCPEFHRCTPQSDGKSVCCGLEISEICPTKVYPTMKVEKCSLCGIGFECHKNYCCPQKGVACSRPPPILAFGSREGTDTEVIIRFYYDSETNTCRSFAHIPPQELPEVPQNHFHDHESCIEMCVFKSEEELEEEDEDNDETLFNCPSPYSNPKDHPQICVPNRKSCSDAEQCQQTESGNFVCCSKPASMSRIIHNICGASYLPLLDRQGNVQRCATNSKCSSKICKRSLILRHNICCKSRPNSVKKVSLSLFSPLSADAEKKICDDSENMIGANCLKKLFPGEAGCQIDAQCVDSKCKDQICQCSQSLVLFRRMCASKCPLFYKNRDGICV